MPILKYLKRTSERERGGEGEGVTEGGRETGGRRERRRKKESESV